MVDEKEAPSCSRQVEDNALEGQKVGFSHRSFVVFVPLFIYCLALLERMVYLFQQVFGLGGVCDDMLCKA